MAGLSTTRSKPICLSTIAQHRAIPSSSPPGTRLHVSKRGQDLLQELDTVLTSHHHNVRSWDTVATEAGKEVLEGLAILLRYAGNMPDSAVPQGRWDLAIIGNWVTDNLMNDEHPVTGETTEARQAFWLVWPYLSTVSERIVHGQSNLVDWEFFTCYPLDNTGELVGSGNDTMEDDDHDMDRLQKTTEKLTLEGEAMEDS